jgi:hypothetical protein
VKYAPKTSLLFVFYRTQGLLKHRRTVLYKEARFRGHVTLRQAMQQVAPQLKPCEVLIEGSVLPQEKWDMSIDALHLSNGAAISVKVEG